ncbi:hypothetical protein ABQW67_08725 [Xanthomonas hortorum]|uniref:Uncharacterized protein n=1 Tax=Xanthomonas hortorum pv. vitians TaxID=83224 RepID=A0AAW8ZUB7_9XANT|nr:hypothetical protein [Xanthomonas hortorum]MCC8495521.1 hypothetical protein [Xanthomonas hortorum pv. gardneri]MCC8555364.1 hypothetical protein [Xanthomonas hortorum pv. gardneri]MCE4283874.1 hypothetical protein [Xanthomonas hortorum pv. vitians]MCE4288196.1 hypothetical protein [Xanthomonas hortorum pv. vitians]MCE4292430.1 hypothetical protein [Xanthomonas hortorum pv. vitians]
MLASTTGEAAIICQLPAEHCADVFSAPACIRWSRQYLKTKRAGNAGSFLAIAAILGG